MKKLIYTLVILGLAASLNAQWGSDIRLTNNPLSSNTSYNHAWCVAASGNIVHVGIIWKRNKIIHASGKVRIDNVDQWGIFNVDTKRYTHKMRVMKRIIK